MTSQYLTDAAARAAHTTEDDARIIMAAIPPGKTYEEALQRAVGRAKHLWCSYEWMMQPEDARITELQNWCTRLCQSNRRAGELLATTAIWSMGAYE